MANTTNPILTAGILSGEMIGAMYLTGYATIDMNTTKDLPKIKKTKKGKRNFTKVQNFSKVMQNNKPSNSNL